jgi:hypothetical protein
MKQSAAFLSLGAMVLAGLMSVFLLPATGHAVVFNVNDFGDAVAAAPATGCDTAPGNGICTLRSAIQAANAMAGPDTINLPAGTYNLTIEPTHKFKN